jgi:CRISPR-associated protein Cas2
MFKTMKGYGRHVQFSVFECSLDKAGYSELLIKIRSIIKPAEDNVRIYPLCLDCQRTAVVIGHGPAVKTPDVLIA